MTNTPTNPDEENLVEIAQPKNESEGILMSTYLGAYGVGVSLMQGDDPEGPCRLMVHPDDVLNAKQLLSQSQFA